MKPVKINLTWPPTDLEGKAIITEAMIVPSAVAAVGVGNDGSVGIILSGGAELPSAHNLADTCKIIWGE